MSDKPTGVNKATWGHIQRIDEFMSLQETDIRQLLESVGELRQSLDAVWRQVVRQQEQINELKEQVELLKARPFIDINAPGVSELTVSKRPTPRTMTGSIEGLDMPIDNPLTREQLAGLEDNTPCPPPVWTGTIQGLEGEWTVTPPPEFEA